MPEREMAHAATIGTREGPERDQASVRTREARTAASQEYSLAEEAAVVSNEFVEFALLDLNQDGVLSQDEAALLNQIL